MSAESRIRRSLSTADSTDRLLRRIRCQIEFARALGGERFAGSVREAEAIMQAPIDSVDGLRDAVARAETTLAPLAGEAKSLVIHCVGHGHIDMNWMWSWPETCATTHDTFASVLALMEEYPELTYSQSQASVYAMIERYHPAMFEAIRARVAEGRWEVAAVHWVEGDKNLASGEALARHLLYTRRYFQEKFGLAPEDCQLDWEPDTFGHCNTLPGILRQGGVKYYYCCRPGGGQEHARVGDERPPVFWWQGPDGSRVLVNRETTWYNSYVEIGDNFALPAVEFWKKTGLRDWMNVYGIGNHGGGPTRAEIEFFLETREWPCWPTVIFGTAQTWFRKIEPHCADMPVLDHELNFEFTGCYTSQSAIKKANRYGENYCLEAEVLSAIHEGVGGREPAASRSLLREAWINVLFNQFHDILPGSGVAATRHHALALFQETGAITGAIKRSALDALGAGIDTLSLLPDTPDARDERENLVNAPFEAGSGQGAGLSGLSRASGGGNRFRPVMIFNPCAWARSEMVEIDLYDLPEDIAESDLVALDETGRAHPTLPISSISGGNHDWGHRRTTVLFHAPDIPAMGYRTFLFTSGEAAADECVRTLGETEMETRHLGLKLSKYASGAERVTARASGEIIESGLSAIGQWEFGIESPKGMSAWLLSNERYAWSELVGYGPSFRLIGARRNEATDLRTGANFAVVASQKLQVGDTKSTVALRTVIGATEPRIDWIAHIDWREIGDAERGIPGLRVTFPAGDWSSDSPDEPALIFETAFGVVERRIGEPGWVDDRPEVPSLRFVHVPGTTKPESGALRTGITLVQDSKYGFSLRGGLTMRVLRSSYDPDHAPEVAKSSVRYAAIFHSEKPSNADLVRLGAAFNHPLMVTPIRLQSGSSPTSRSFVEVLTEGVVLSALKPADEGAGFAIRLVNYEDADIEAVVRIDETLVQGAVAVTCADLMERSVAGEVARSGNLIRTIVPGRGFATLVLRPS